MYHGEPGLVDATARGSHLSAKTKRDHHFYKERNRLLSWEERGFVRLLNRRSFLGGAAGAAAVACSRSRSPRKPNVILVMTDDQGYGDFSCFGNPRLKTPNLDRLREESVRFTDFHVTPMCAPTRAQLMTGRDAMFTGTSNPSSGRGLLRTDLPTMADVFAGGGYRTGLFSKWNLGDTYPYRPQDRGFEEAVWFPSTHVGSLPDAWNNDYFSDQYRHGDRLQQYEGYCTDVFFGEAMKWMRERSAAQEPFFTYLPLNAPHKPFFVPPRYREPYSDLPPRLANFYGMIANIDDNMGRLETMLRETGLRENTILVFLTDNGTVAGSRFFNPGMRGRKVQLWEGGHRVPCFIRWPSGELRPPGDVGGLTECQDLLPTLIEMCGLEPRDKPEFDGASLAGVLRGEAEPPPDRILVVQYTPVRVAAGVVGGDQPPVEPAIPERGDAAVMWRRWRLLNDKELYNLETDPQQHTNVIDKHPKIVAKMRRHYDAWWKRVEPHATRFPPTHIGTAAENPVLISACEWAGVWMDQCLQVRRGDRRNGLWHIHVERPGDYEISLRRWPESVDVAICEGLPPHEGEIGSYPAGVALPVARARLRIGEQDLDKPVGNQDKAAAFRLRLPQGRTDLKTWFYDKAGEEICGAYYVIAHRLMVAIVALFLLAGGMRAEVRPYAENPWYWQYDGRPVLLLGGSDSDNIFQWAGEGNKLVEQLNLLRKVGGNYIRCAMSSRQYTPEGYRWNLLPYPYAKVNGVYDLHRWDAVYWGKLKTFLVETKRRGIIVQLEFFDRWNESGDSRKPGFGWYDSPWNPNNNSTYDWDDSPLLKPGETAFYNPFHLAAVYRDPVLLEVQQNYIRKLLDVVIDGGFDHVLFQVDNESGIGDATLGPDPYWARFAREYAASKKSGWGIYVCTSRRFHFPTPYKTTRFQNWDNPEIRVPITNAAFNYLDISQNNGVTGQTHYDNVIWYREKAASHGGARPVNNTKCYHFNWPIGAEWKEHSAGTDAEASARPWRVVFAGGASIRFHRETAFRPGGIREGYGLGPEAQTLLRSLRLFAERVPLFTMEPHNDLLSQRSDDEAYCLAGPGAHYAVFFTGRGDRTVGLDLGGAAMPVALSWLNVADSQWRNAGTLPGDRVQTLSPPKEGLWVAVFSPATAP